MDGSLSILSCIERNGVLTAGSETISRRCVQPASRAVNNWQTRVNGFQLCKYIKVARRDANRRYDQPVCAFRVQIPS